jgi:hypothetical protein
MKLCAEKGRNSDPTSWTLRLGREADYSPPTNTPPWRGAQLKNTGTTLPYHYSAHMVLSSSCGLKMDYWNRTPTLWFGWRHWKLLRNRNSRNVSNSVAASLVKVHSSPRGVLQWWTLSVNCKYTGMRAIKPFQERHSDTQYLLRDVFSKIKNTVIKSRYFN